MRQQTKATPPAPFYTVEALIGTKWTVLGDATLRAGAIALARELAQENGCNNLVYLHTRTGQRKHIFCAHPPVVEVA